MKFAYFLACALAMLPLGTAQADTPGPRPNIVLILADDLGWGELGVQGGKDVPTPRIDSIATGGVRFTSGYVSCPVCSPTRAGMLTGRYQQRFGHEFNPGNEKKAPANFGLPLDQVTIANRLHDLGYATGMVGKSHLGYKPAYNPSRRGFDEFYGFLAGARPYYPDNSERNATPILRGTERVAEDFDLTTFGFAREAAAFVERHKESPFFLYLPFNAVHAPLQAPDAYRERFAGIQDERRQTFCAMLAILDEAVGIVLDALDKNSLSENTLVFFISDNGGPTPTTTSGNGPLRGTKATIYEGGIRIPYFMKWPGHLPAGKTYDFPVISLDVLPTAIAAAGAETKPEWKLDGVNLLPYITGENPGRPHEDLFWRYGEQFAIRHNDMKYLVSRKEYAAPQLYDLSKDISESTNLVDTQADTAQDLKARYDAWNALNIDPLWGNEAYTPYLKTLRMDPK